MCGICGILHFDAARPVDPARLTAMTRVLAHRGPDGEGMEIDGAAGVGHRRLSIIDPSPLGRQPMASDDERFWLVFNGEIYNYVELRRELVARGHQFRSHTDSEVLLRLFVDEGADCLRRLNGMFAFAIWDRRERTFFAARDRLGVKPFYYAIGDRTFVFGSEIKALLQSGVVTAEVDREGLADYLTFQFCLADRTLFRGVRRLLPGQSMRVAADGTVSIETYWKLDFTVDTRRSEGEFREELARLLEDSVRLELRSDVPLGAHLSGGLDSSVVCSLAAAQMDSPLHTFSGAFAEGADYDERQYSRRVAAHIGAHGHEVVPTADDFVRVLPRLIYHMDEPAAGPGLFSQFLVSELARRHVKVVLGGQGGDELFGGYSRYLIAYLEECIRGGIAGTQEAHPYVVTFETVVRHLPQLRGYESLLQYFWRDGLFDPPDQRYYRLIDRSRDIEGVVDPAVFEPQGYRPFDAFRDLFNDGETQSYINRMTRFDQRTLLPALLQVEDRTSMAVSLESRVPLLDHRIAELAASMPPMLKYLGGQSKHVLRLVTRDLLPPEVSERQDKKGFQPPLDIWYRRGPVRDFVGDLLGGATSRQRGLLDTGGLTRLLGTERRFGRGIWGLLSLELWWRAFIDAPCAEPDPVDRLH